MIWYDMIVLLILMDFNPLKHGGGGAVLPSLPCFLPFTHNILRQPIPENSWTCKPFCCWCPYKKIEHFEIWVWKAAMGERVKTEQCHEIHLWHRIVPSLDIKGYMGLPNWIKLFSSICIRNFFFVDWIFFS